MPAETLQVLTLDLDDTLWDNGPILDRAEQVLHAWLGERCPALAARHSIAAMQTHRQALKAGNPRLEHDVTALRRTSLAILARDCGYSEAIAEEAMAVFLEARSQVRLYDDVLPVLERLRTRVRLVALTNGNVDIGRAGIGHLFDLALSAGDVGLSKPHPAMFQAVMARFGIGAAAMAHAGDDPVTDVAGAHNAGVRSVWVNRRRQPWPGEYRPPHAEVRGLDEMEPLLEAWFQL